MYRQTLIAALGNTAVGMAQVSSRICGMGSERAERSARNEAMFRLANERMADWEEHHANSAVEPYFCECSAPDCREHVDLRKAEYVRLRSDSRWFVVLPGHEVPDLETVIERHEGWAMVEKAPEVSDTLEALDPRSDG